MLCAVLSSEVMKHACGRPWAYLLVTVSRPRVEAPEEERGTVQPGGEGLEIKYQAIIILILSDKFKPFLPEVL